MVTKKEQEQLPKIRDLKRKIKELETQYEELRASVGYLELRGWKPDPRIEMQYGWVHSWLTPLYNYMNHVAHVDPYVRNKIVSIVKAVIAQLVISGKYGIDFPHEPKEGSIDLIEKQIKSYELNFDPCVICGENRITHYCHIIPRSEGGPNHVDNFVILCPLHHHLFDNNRLNEDEWQVLMKVLETKMPSAVFYVKEVREKQLQRFWTNPKPVYPLENGLHNRKSDI